MPITSTPELLAALELDPNLILGLAESIWLDFKGEPYRLDQDYSKLEFAKDVSAMTADNGVIVLGVSTKKDDDTQEETADALRPISAERIDVQRMTSLAREFIYPPLNIAVNKYSVPNANGFIWAIVGYPKANEFPYIVNAELTPDGRPSRKFFGVFERTPAASSESTPASLVHSWIQRGRNVGQLASVPVEPVLPPEPVGQSPTNSRELSTARINDADVTLRGDLDATELEKRDLYYYIQAMPLEAVRLENFFEGAVRSMKSAMQHVDSLRPSGFNLPQYKEPVGTGAGYRTVGSRDQTFSVTRTGITTLVVSGQILTWAMDKYVRNNPGVNIVALTETTLEFWRFFESQVLSRASDTKPTVAWRAGITNGTKTVVPLSVAKYYKHGQPYWEDDFKRTETPIEVHWQIADFTTADRMAFVTLQELYDKFELDSSLILGQVDGQRIDPDVIRRL